MSRTPKPTPVKGNMYLGSIKQRDIHNKEHDVNVINVRVVEAPGVERKAEDPPTVTLLRYNKDGRRTKL